MNYKFYLLLGISTSLLNAQYDAQAYHNSNVGQFKYAIKEMYKLNLSGSEKILDIGSGDGCVSTYIAQEYIPKGQLVGIDSSKEMVAFASLHSRLTNVSYIAADACQYVAPNEYDVITSFWTLHWVKEYGLAINNIAQSLKPGGKALLCHVIGKDPLQIIVNELLETEKWKAYKENKRSWFNAPSLLQIAQALEAAELSVESLEIKKNSEWIDVDLVKQNLLSMPFFDFIPSQLRAEFCDDVLTAAQIDIYPRNEKNEIFDWLPVVVMVLRKAL